MSALTNFKGDGPWWHSTVSQTAGAPSISSAGLIDASTEKVAMLGYVWHPTVKTGTINIRKVHFMTGTVTFNVASTLRVSLQNVSATAGPPYQPDGTQDQTYDFVGAGLSSNAWTTTGNLSADRAVSLSAVNLSDANSRLVAVVFEYQTFTAADSININGLSLGSNSPPSLIGGAVVTNTGSWAYATFLPIIAFECDDGTFAFFENSMPVKTASSTAVASNATARAAGLKFKVPMEMKIDGFGLLLMVPNGCDGSMVLYDSNGTTVLVSIEIDNDAVSGAGSARYAFCRCPPVTLAANTNYRIAFVGSTTTSASVYYMDVNAAGLQDGLIGGQDFMYTERDSGGTWTDTTTRRPVWSIKLSAVHDGVGGGGSLMVHPGMGGGCNG